MNETLKRTLSGVVYVILLIASIKFSTISFFVLFGAFLLIAVYEFCNLTNINKIFPLILSVFLYSLNCKIITASKDELLFYNLKYNNLKDLILLLLTLLVTIKSLFFLFNENKKIKIFSKYIYLIGYIIFPFIIITKIPYGIAGYNSKILISIFILIWTNDSFAYIVGKSIGKNKLFEQISPKKTIEGFLGGLFFCIISSLLISKYYIESNNILIWVIIALITAIFGTVGDLVESKFKRIAGVKDSGKIMPGHGGILDRLDSIIFVAPIVFLFYQILNYVS